MVDAGITTLVISKSASAMFTMNALPAKIGIGNSVAKTVTLKQRHKLYVRSMLRLGWDR